MTTRVWVSERVGAAIETIAAQTGRTMGQVADDAIVAALERHVRDEAAAAARFRATVDVRRLTVAVEGRFLVILYADRFAGIAVDVHETGRMSTQTVTRWDSERVELRQYEQKGLPPIVSWCPWFVDLCRLGGKELAA